MQAGHNEDPSQGTSLPRHQGPDRTTKTTRVPPSLEPSLLGINLNLTAFVTNYGDTLYLDTREIVLKRIKTTSNQSMNTV